jgi:hypothetical protein
LADSIPNSSSTFLALVESWGEQKQILSLPDTPLTLCHLHSASQPRAGTLVSHVLYSSDDPRAIITKSKSQRPHRLTVKFTHLGSYSIFDPSSTLNPRSTIAFPVKNNHCKGPFPKP